MVSNVYYMVTCLGEEVVKPFLLTNRRFMEPHTLCNRLFNAYCLSSSFEQKNK